jgi:hypothetical protein
MQNTQSAPLQARRSVPKEDRPHLPRVKVLSVDGTPLLGMDYREARIAVRDNKAVGKHIKGEYHIQMLSDVGKVASLA